MFTSILTNFSSVFNYCFFELHHANTSSQSPTTWVKILAGTLTQEVSQSCQLKIVPKVMLTVNLDIQDHLMNGQLGNISHLEFAQDSVQICVFKVFWGTIWLKGNEIILFRQTKFLGSYWKMWNWDSNKEGLAFPPIKYTQFPLTLAWVSTVHKVQGLSLE